MNSGPDMSKVRYLALLKRISCWGFRRRGYHGLALLQKIAVKKDRSDVPSGWVVKQGLIVVV